MLSVSLVRNEQGEPACFISQIQNITERHLVEEALRESEYFSREIQRVARLGGWKANPHTDYLEWSDGVYELVEAPRDYAPSLTEGLKFYLPEYIPIIRDSVGNCLNTGEPFCIECEVITTTGRRLWTEVRGLAPVTEGERSYVTGGGGAAGESGMACAGAERGPCGHF
jgi:PAS domain-containing protein